MARREGHILLTIRFFQEGDQWTARCEELGTATCADTLDEANEAISSLILLHLNTLEDVGERKAFFAEHGIEFHRGKPKTPSRPARVSIRVGELVRRITEPIPSFAGG